MVTLLTLVIGTFVSEDLTCVLAGVLIQRRDISATAGLLACVLGIFLGDFGLWGIGRIVGRAGPRWSWVLPGRPTTALSETAGWLRRNAPAAILCSRFLPGTRLPLYLMAGALGIRGRVFATSSLLAALLWTPPVVLLTAKTGDTFVDHLRNWMAVRWLPLAVTAMVVLAALHLVRAGFTRVRWHRLAARIARWSRWEFWPSTITATNPGMPDAEPSANRSPNPEQTAGGRRT